MKSMQSQSSGTGDPVCMVNWYHAIAFCNKLSVLEGLTPVYTIIKAVPIDWENIRFGDVPQEPDAEWDAVTAYWSNDGYRLPTETEWMWAAIGAPSAGRNGGVDTTGYRKAYAGSVEGDKKTKLGNYAWYQGNANNKTHPVGSKKMNELGLYDMAGNVAELCWDWWSDTAVSGPATDYRGASPGDYRVMKGGSRFDDDTGFAITNRSNPEPEWAGAFIGFRVVRR